LALRCLARVHWYLLYSDHIKLGNDVYDRVDDLCRSHVRPDGRRAQAPSHLIEDAIQAYVSHYDAIVALDRSKRR